MGGRRRDDDGKGSLELSGLLVAQRFQNAEEQVEVIQRVLQGRLSLEYILWNGRTDVVLPTDDPH